MGLHIQLDKSSSTCVDFGFGRLSGFFRDLNFSVPSRIWYLLVSLAIQNLERNLGDRISYSIREHLKNLQKIPSDFTWISRKHQETATRAPVDLTLHIEFSSTLAFVACWCPREAGSFFRGISWGRCLFVWDGDACQGISPDPRVPGGACQKSNPGIYTHQYDIWVLS
jgi:hypothetical protein